MGIIMEILVFISFSKRMGGNRIGILVNFLISKILNLMDWDQILVFVTRFGRTPPKNLLNCSTTLGNDQHLAQWGGKSLQFEWPLFNSKKIKSFLWNFFIKRVEFILLAGYTMAEGGNDNADWIQIFQLPFISGWELPVYGGNRTADKETESTP